MIKIKQASPTVLKFKSKESMEKLNISNNAESIDKRMSDIEKREGELSKVPTYDTDCLVNAFKEDDASDSLFNVEQDINSDVVDNGVLATEDIDMLAEEFLNDIVAEDKSQDSVEESVLKKATVTKPLENIAEKIPLKINEENTNGDCSSNVRLINDTANKTSLESDNLVKTVSQNIDELQKVENKDEAVEQSILEQKDILEKENLVSDPNKDEDITKNESVTSTSSIREIKNNNLEEIGSSQADVEKDISNLEKEIDDVSHAGSDIAEEDLLLDHDDEDDHSVEKKLQKDKSKSVIESEKSKSLSATKETAISLTNKSIEECNHKSEDNITKSSEEVVENATEVAQGDSKSNYDEMNCKDTNVGSNSEEKEDIGNVSLIKPDKNKDIVNIEAEKSMDESVKNNIQIENNKVISKMKNSLDEDVRSIEKPSKLVEEKPIDCDVINLDDDDENEDLNSKTEKIKEYVNSTKKDTLKVIENNTELRTNKKESVEKGSNQCKGNNNIQEGDEDDILVIDSPMNSPNNIAEKSNEVISSKKDIDKSKVNFDDDEECDIMFVEATVKAERVNEHTKDKEKEEIKRKTGVVENKTDKMQESPEKQQEKERFMDDDVVVLEDENTSIEENKKGLENKNETKFKQIDHKLPKAQLDQEEKKGENLSTNTNQGEVQNLNNKRREESEDVVIVDNELDDVQTGNANLHDNKIEKNNVEKMEIDTKGKKDVENDEIVVVDVETGDKQFTAKNSLESQEPEEVIKSPLKDLNCDENDDVVFIDNEVEKIVNLETSKKSTANQIKQPDLKINTECNNKGETKEAVEKTKAINSNENNKEVGISLDSKKAVEEETKKSFKAEQEKVITITSDNSDNAQDKFPDKTNNQQCKNNISANNDGDNALLRQVDSPQNSRSDDNLCSDQTKDSKIENSETENSVEPPSKRLRMHTRQSERLRNSNSKEEIETNEPIIHSDDMEVESKKTIKRSISADTPLQDIKKRKVSTLHDYKTDIDMKKDMKSESNGDLLKPIPRTPRKIDLHLDFLRKFKKSVSKMTKADLEELVLQKVVEAFMHKSEFSEMRDLIEQQEKLIATHRAKITEITKQFRDLEMVHNRVLKDLETRNQQYIMPVKITRAVGLQVVIPKKPDQNTAKANTPQNNNSAENKNRKILPKPVTYSDNSQQTQNINRNVIQSPVIASTSVQQAQLQKGQQKIVTRSAVAVPTIPQQGIIAVNQTSSQQYVVGQLISSQHTVVANQTPRKTTPIIRQPSPAIQRSAAPQNSPDRPRVPPMILKKTGTNGRMLAVATSSAVAPIIATSSNQQIVPSVNKSVIDLTDEDEGVSRSYTNGAFPALVAIPSQNQPNRVTYLVNKPNNITQRVTVTQPPASTQRSTSNKLNQYVNIAPKLPVQSNNANRKQPIRRHPAPLPKSPPALSNPGWKAPPPRPSIRINNITSGIVISWTMDEMNDEHAEITSYQIYAYQETSAPPQVEAWRHVGDVKAMLLPMAVTLTQFQEGQRYYFAVRAVDMHSRCGPFSTPKTWV